MTWLPDPDKYQYRILHPDEWDHLRAFWTKRGYPAASLPSPTVAKVAVAIHNSEIIAFWVLQLVLHAEPLHIDVDHRGKVSWVRMLHLLEQTMVDGSSYYVFSPDEKISGMCKAVDLIDTGWKTFKKMVGGRCLS